MLKLLIADDEKYERVAIVDILNKEFKELFEMKEVKNGREAIEISEQIIPDIIIMDIKMPGINGLSAIKEIKKFLPNVYVIILTAYDYFDFAMEAVKNNVKGYILKPFSKIELIEKIREAIDFVNTEKEKRKNEIENQEKFYNLVPIVENELCYSIINDMFQSIDYENYMRYLGVNFKNTCSIVVQSKEKSHGENLMEGSWEYPKSKIDEYVKEHIHRKYRAIGSDRFTKELVYFIQVKDDENEDETRLDMVNLAVSIRGDIKRLFGVSVKIGIGKCYEGLEQMNKSYKEACKSLEYDSESINIIHYQDINTHSREKELLNEKLQNNDRGKFVLFKDVEKYIIDNMKEEMDLERIAAKFNLSSYYFSRTFKEVLGYNFSDYINIIRINRAKKLLKNDSMSIKEICYSLGYSDPNYFSKVFKKYEGLSPTEFRLK